MNFYDFHLAGEILTCMSEKTKRNGLTSFFLLLSSRGRRGRVYTHHNKSFAIVVTHAQKKKKKCQSNTTDRNRSFKK